MSLSRWVTKKQIAEMMEVSLSTVKRKVKSCPDFPKPWRNGNKIVRFKEDEVEEYIRKQLDNEGQLY